MTLRHLPWITIIWVTGSIGLTLLALTDQFNPYKGGLDFASQFNSFLHELGFMNSYNVYYNWIMSKMPGMFNPYKMNLDWNFIIQTKEMWRPFTALFYFPLSQQTAVIWLLMLLIVCVYSGKMEIDVFNNKRKNYLFLLIGNWLLCCAIAGGLTFFGYSIDFLLEPMAISLFFIWCKLNRNTVVYREIELKAEYMPYILVPFYAYLRNGEKKYIVVATAGLIVGYVGHWLMFECPRLFGGDPQALSQRRLGGFGNGGRLGGGPVARPPQNRGERRHQWGRGRALNGN